MDVNLLISLVYSKRPVWDRSDKRHSSRFVVDKCWREISTQMNKDENKLRKKWKYLRDQFSIEYGKVMVNQLKDEDSKYEPKWPYFQPLMFLKEFVKKKKLKVPSKRSIASVERNDSDHSHDDNPEESNDPFEIQIEPCEVKQEIITSDAHEEHSEDSYTVPRKRSASKFIENMIDVEKKKIEYMQERIREYEDDEHLLFFRSLLPHIRKIPQERLLSFRNDIQNTVNIYTYQSQ